MVTVNPCEDVEYYMDGYLYELLTSFKDAIKNKNTSVVIIVDGRSGMGKTTFSNQIAKYCDPNYGLNNLYFEPEKFLEGLANAKEGSAHAFDEAMLISSRSSMSHINRMIIQAMSMIRSKKILVIFNVNAIFDLDRNLALSRADLLLHVYGDNLIDRGNFAAFFKPKKQEDRIKQLYLLGKKYYSYSKPKANFYGRFYPKFIIDEKEYEKLKDIGVNNFLIQNIHPLGKHTQIEIRLIKYLKEVDKLNPKEIAEIAGVTYQTIYNKLNFNPQKS